jgi:prevent-host-death family protein
MQRVGLRELNQNASAVVRQVAAEGVSIEVTDRGRPVARIVPVARPDRLEELIERGDVIASDGRDPLPVEPLTLPAGCPPLSQILEEMRNAERY